MGAPIRGGKASCWESDHCAASHPAAIPSVTTATGTPVRACRRQSITTPHRRAASTTMMYAIDPTISRLPASVLTSASVSPTWSP